MRAIDGEDPLAGIGTASRPAVAATRFRDGLILHEPGTGRIYYLNRTAADLWPAAADAAPEALARRLALAHGFDAARTLADVTRFVAAIRATGLARGSPVRAAGLAARVPSGPPTLNAVYRLIAAPVTVRCHLSRFAAAFARLAAPARQESGGSACPTLEIFRYAGRLVLARDGQVVGRFTTGLPARWRLIQELLGAPERLWLARLHASAAATAAGTVLLCGGSGAGKSTLLAGLIARGLRYVGDDVVPIAAGTGRPWPTRLAISLKEGSWPLLANQFPELAAAPATRFGGRTMRYLWPGEARTVALEAGRPVALLVFPRRRPGTEPAVARLDVLSTLLRLGEGGSVLPATDAGLNEFLAWLERTPAFELTYDRLDHGVAAIARLRDTVGDTEAVAAG